MERQSWQIKSILHDGHKPLTARDIQVGKCKDQRLKLESIARKVGRRSKVKEIDDVQLVKKAAEAMKTSYAPYSQFNVGAALLTSEGDVFCGCNIENSSFGCCNCAERTAIFKAVSEGKHSFSAIAVVGGKSGNVEDFCPPCGTCRQVLAEFCDKDFRVVMADKTGKIKVMTLGNLLPQSFSL